MQPGAAWPAQGWAPMPGAGWPPQAGWQAAYDWNDPLVNPPGAGVEGWFTRAWSAVRRSWRPLLPILLLTQVLPAIALNLYSVPFQPEFVTAPPTSEVAPAELQGMLGDMFTYYAALLAGAVVSGLLAALGWAAGLWVLTRQAAGEPVTVGGAFGYAVRRALGLWGWSLLAGMIIGVGVCACVLPGIYLAFALSMAIPVYVFERRNPIGRSFGITHARFGMVLGRLAIVFGLVIAGAVVVTLMESLGLAALGGGLTEPAALTPGFVVISVLTGLLYLPIYLLMQAGLLTTYAEQRAMEAPVNTARLVGELG